MLSHIAQHDSLGFKESLVCMSSLSVEQLISVGQWYNHRALEEKLTVLWQQVMSLVKPVLAALPEERHKSP